MEDIYWRVAGVWVTMALMFAIGIVSIRIRVSGVSTRRLIASMWPAAATLAFAATVVSVALLLFAPRA